MSKHVSDLFKASDYFKVKFIPVWLLLGFLKITSFFSYRSQLKIGRTIGWVIKKLTPNKHTIISTNLKLCFPDKSQHERDQLLNKTYANFGISFIELGLCWWWSDEKLLDLVEIKGMEHLELCKKNNKGIILLTGHFSSLEIAGRLFSLFSPMQVMYRTQKNRLFDSYLFTQRSKIFVNTISRKNTRQLIKGIRNKIPTWYAPDQDFSDEQNIFAPFFGIPTATITASARLAKASKAVILPYFSVRKDDGSGYVIHIQKPLENFPTGDELEDATAINRSIENNVRCYPDQYMWLHKRFKTRPEGEKNLYIP